MFKRLGHFFISGLMVLAPAFFTIWVVFYLVRIVDGSIVNPFFTLLPIETDARFKVLLTKLAITICVFFLIVVCGYLAERILFKQFAKNFEELIKRIPLFSNVYNSVKEVLLAFFGDKKGIFRSVVFVEYPRKGVYAMGFVTLDKPWELTEKSGKDLVSVFVPSPPNPATGNFVFVPREEVIWSEMTIEEGIRIVISVGAAVPNGKIK